MPNVIVRHAPPSFTLALALTVALLAACSARNHIGTETPGTAGTGGQAVGTGGRGGGAGTLGGAGAGGTSMGGAGAGGNAAGGAGGGAGVAAAGRGGGAAGAAGAAGAIGTGPQPRVLFVDPPTSRFLSYDRDGQPVHDYGTQLDFGSGFGGRGIWLDGWLPVNWDGAQPTGAYASAPPPRGFDEPLAASVMMIRAAATSGSTIKVKALRADGSLLATQTLSGTWTAFQISPRRTYLYAQSNPSNTSQVNAIIRVSDGHVMWQGWAAMSGFSRDDRHFVFFPGGGATALPHIIDLVTGTETTSTSSQIPLQLAVTFSLDAVVNDWAVFRANWNSYGQLLWAVDWQGTVTRFGADMPMYVDEYAQQFDPTGTHAVWSRQNNGSGGQPAAYLGAWEIDSAATARTPWDGADFSCFRRPSEVAFKIVGSALQSCACSDNTCTTIATLPAVPQSGWLPRLLVSADRRTVVVGYDWGLNSLPTSYPEIVALRANGDVIGRFSFGFAELDDTGQLLLIRPWLPGAGTRQLGIVNLVAGTATWLDSPQTAAILYE